MTENKTVKTTTTEENKKAIDAIVETAKKAPAKKAPAKTAIKESLYIQFLGKDIEKAELIERAKAVYKETGGKAAIKSIDLYVKIEESAVYYVINGDISGRFDI